MAIREQIRLHFRLFVVVAAAVIGGLSLIYTNILVNELVEREQKTIDLFAKAQKLLGVTEDAQVMTFLLQEITAANTSIPVILKTEITDIEGVAPDYESLNLIFPQQLKNKQDTLHFLIQEAQKMEKAYAPIIIESAGIKQTIFYRNSDLIFKLKYYPYIQLGVITMFALMAYLVFSYSRRAEQNKLWAGLAKETAHQLGTPLSSLVAWVEYMKSSEQFANSEIIPELEKDIQKFEIITTRFSQIGSVPELKNEDIAAVIQHTIDYLQKRINRKIIITLHNQLSPQFTVALNRFLFEWVIENICKNAVDAITPPGQINIYLTAVPEKVIIDISDTGKGITRNKINRVFEPGYSSKKRGWGLGLTLAKRIVENYHKGKIFVKQSEIDKGTTFRIVLPI